MDNNYYAASNLRTIAESIASYASFAEDKDGEFYELMEKAGEAVRALADHIQPDNN